MQKAEEKRLTGLGLSMKARVKSRLGDCYITQAKSIT